MLALRSQKTKLLLLQLIFFVLALFHVPYQRKLPSSWKKHFLLGFSRIDFTIRTLFVCVAIALYILSHQYLLGKYIILDGSKDGVANYGLLLFAGFLASAFIMQVMNQI